MAGCSFCSSPPSLCHRQLKHPHNAKISIIMLSASLTSVFHTKFTYQNWNSTKHSIRIVIELWPLILESSAKISKFHALPDWKSAIITRNHRLGTRCMGVPLVGSRSSANNGVSLKKIYIPMHKVWEQLWRHFTSLKLCKSSQIPLPSPSLASASSRTRPNHHWLNHLHILYMH